MYFIKKINNNVAFARDDNGLDWIILGKGVGFGRSSKDIIDDDSISKKFKAIDGIENKRNMAFLTQIDTELLEIVTRVSNRVEDLLDITLSDYNYLALADHLKYAIDRYDEDDESVGDSDLKRIYPREYAAAEVIINQIRDELQVNLAANEVNFLTYHFVNATTNETYLSETVEMTKIIKKIVDLISYAMQIKIDKNSINYTRFITHIRYFIIRQSKEQSDTERLDEVVSQTIRKKYPVAYQTAKKIARILEQQNNWIVSDEEQLYLTLHIWRLTRKY